MNFQRFEFDVKVVVKLTPEEVDFFHKASQLHYDGKCKAAGRPGGFIFGWCNMLRFEEETPEEIEVTIDGYALGVMSKIIEISDHVGNNGAEVGAKLMMEIAQLHSARTQQWQSLST